MSINKNTAIIFIASGLVGVGAIFAYKQFFSIKAKAVRKANAEWKQWGEQEINSNNQTVKSGAKEDQSGFSEKVNQYWKEGTGLNYSGKDRDVAWSSAFISYLWKKAGAGNKFVYSASHSDYIRDSINNRKSGDFRKSFLGLKTPEYPPKVGDLVCYSREDNPNLYDATGGYKSHCDIVVKKGNGFIEVIGGNVGQAVTKKTLLVDKKGFLIDKNYDWFAVLKSNL